MEEILALVDQWLSLTAQRDMFAAEDCQDRLLDIRDAVVRRDPVPA